MGRLSAFPHSNPCRNGLKIGVKVCKTATHTKTANNERCRNEGSLGHPLLPFTCTHDTCGTGNSIRLHSFSFLKASAFAACCARKNYLKSRQNRQRCGRSNKVWVARSPTTFYKYGIMRGHHGGVTCVLARSDLLLELSRAAAVPPEFRNLNPREQTSTAVLTNTAPNLLNCGSTE